jgi:DNA-binding CsgD family transcriptional regulator
MTDYSRIPWPQIHHCLVEVGSERAVKKFTHKLLEEISLMIPFDISTCTFCEDSKTFAVKEAFGVSDEWNQKFISYYSRILPFDLRKPGVIDWENYRHYEFVTDFIKPLGIRRSIGLILNSSLDNPIQISLHRSQYSQNFDERATIIMEILTPHLTNIYNYLNIIALLNKESGDSAALVAEYKVFSKREAEVAALASKRLSAAEIGSLLQISPRTVEKHIASIYAKLKVKNRHELFSKLSRDLSVEA